MTRSREILVAVPLLLLLWATPSLALDDRDPGAGLYERYCASCHGESGTGNGPVAAALLVKPTDLTTIAARNDGRFPFWETMRVIDGRRTVREHGSSDMPIWGDVFRDEAGWDLARRAEAQGKVAMLTEYVRSIQKGSSAQK